jgi:hypothetical protein
LRCSGSDSFCKAGAYVAIVGGATVQTETGRALAAMIATIAAVVVAYFVGRQQSRRLLRRLCVEAARVEPLSGRISEYPDGRKLLELGQAMGLHIEGTPASPEVIAAFAKRHFGVDRIGWHYPATFPAAPASRVADHVG